MYILIKRFIALILVSVFASSCANNNYGQGGSGLGPLGDLLTKENIGTAAGAAGGAWIGSNVGGGTGKTVAIATGTLLGAVLGKSIGSSLDANDMSRYSRTSQYALENNQAGTVSTWNNPDSRNSGSITPTRTFKTASGVHCREYKQVIYVDGRAEQGYGTACRQLDGSWKLQN